MSENKMNDYLDASLEGVGKFADMNTVIGAPIHTPSGVTVIPVSRVNMGFASGVVDYSSKKFATPPNSGGGGGTGISITPVAFLTVGPGAEVKLLSLNEQPGKIDRAIDLIESAPAIIEKIKDVLS